MRFKIGFLILIGMAFGCAKNSEDPGAGASMSLAIGNTSCLDGSGPKLQNFFSGTGTAADIHGVWTCTQSLLADFTTYTEGASALGYTSAELKGFLTKYYFPGGLSDDTINSTLKLKAALAGGTPDFVTRGEIQKLIQTIGLLDSVTQDLFPVAKLIFTDAHLSASDADWSHAYDIFSAELSRIGTSIGQTGQSYAFTDLGAFLNAWTAQLNLPQTNFVVKIASYVPVLGSAKALLIGGASASVAESEWQPLFSALSSVYSYYRMWVRLTPTGDYAALLAAAKLPWLGGGVTGLLNTAVHRRANGQIPLSEIQNLLTQLEAQGLFPHTLTVAQLTSAIQFLLNRAFTAAGAPSDTLSAVTVAQIQSLLDKWNTYDAALVNHNYSNAAEFGGAVAPSGTFLALDSQGRVLLPVHGGGVFHEYSVIFAVLEFVGQKWGPWPVTQANLDTVVSDWLGVLHTLGFLTGTDNTISPKLMREANLFTMSANGDLLLDKAEAFDFALYALSSYRAAQALAAASSACAATDNACITAAWYTNRAVLLTNFPNLEVWLNGDPSRWPVFSQDVAAVGGAGEWLLQFMVVHFLETYMARFDANQDQTINVAESLTAFPIYQPTLDVLLPQNGLSVADDKPMYTYLFKNGVIPSGFSGYLDYLSWKNSSSSWAYNSDRLMLAKILNSIGSL